MIDWLFERRPWFASYLDLSVLLWFLFCFVFYFVFHLLIRFIFYCHFTFIYLLKVHSKLPGQAKEKPMVNHVTSVILPTEKLRLGSWQLTSQCCKAFTL